MLKFLFAFLVLGTISGFAAEQSIQAPNKLKCKVASCTDENPPENDSTWCDEYQYKDVFIKSINSKQGPRVGQERGKLRRIYEGDVLPAGKVAVDFSDGDQYATYLFDEGDLKKLMTEPASKIPGQFVDAFDWADGYHVRFRKTLDCSAQ